MQFALLWLLPVCFVAQPSEKIEVYVAKDPHSLIVVVTKQNGLRAPAGIQVDLTDPSENVIDSKFTDENGEVLFSHLDASQHPIVRVFARRENLQSQGVEVQWQLFLDRELKLLPASPPSKATQEPSYTVTRACPQYDPIPCCTIPCPPSHCWFDPCEKDFGCSYYLDNVIPRDLGEAKLTVSVPSDAAVFINGKTTTRSC